MFAKCQIGIRFLTVVLPCFIQCCIETFVFLQVMHYTVKQEIQAALTLCLSTCQISQACANGNIAKASESYFKTLI